MNSWLAGGCALTSVALILATNRLAYWQHRNEEYETNRVHDSAVAAWTAIWLILAVAIIGFVGAILYAAFH